MPQISMRFQRPTFAESLSILLWSKVQLVTKSPKYKRMVFSPAGPAHFGIPSCGMISDLQDGRALVSHNHRHNHTCKIKFISLLENMTEKENILYLVASYGVLSKYAHKRERRKNTFTRWLLDSFVGWLSGLQAWNSCMKGIVTWGRSPNQIPTHHDTYQLPCLYLPLFNGSTFCMSLRTLRLKPWWFEVRAEQKKKDASRCEHLRITVRADSTRPVKQAWEYKMCEMWVNSELSWALGPIEHCSLSLSYVNDRFWWSHELFSDDCDCASTWWPSKRSCSHPVSNCDVGVLIMQNLRNPRLTVFPFWWFMTLLASDHLSRTQHFSFVLAFFCCRVECFCAAFSVSKDCQHMSACKAYTDQRSNYKEIRYLPNRLKGKHPALKTGPYISKPRRKKSDAEGCTSVIVDIHTGCSPKTVTTRIPGSWMFTRRIHVSLTCHCFGWWIGPMYWSRILIGTSPRSFQTFESFWFNSHRCHVDKALAGIGHGPGMDVFRTQEQFFVFEAGCLGKHTQNIPQ